MGEEEGILGSLFGCCCGPSGVGEELYKDWESHPACRQYAILKRLGEGGFSEVHMAQDKLTGKTVALKVVFLNRGGLTKDQKKILAGEARLVRMVAHPNIVRCMQVLETRRQQVLVLEHLSGGEMLRQLQRLKRYSEANACQMFKQIADAVAYLHSLGILHRDIKPENCLLAKPAGHYATKQKPVKIKLIDLGMAGLYRPNKPMHGCMGSPGFIAPEVILGEPHSPAMDVYSLGVLLFIMLVGRKPWDAQRSHTLAYAVQPTCEAPGLRDPVFTGLSAPAQKLLCWMLAEDPSRRPSTQQVETSDGFAVAATTAAPSRVYQQVVQQRLQVLAHSRDVMGTARCMMVLHGRGSRSQAVMFHKAVKAARMQLQQQAAALQAAGQMPAGTADFAQAAAAAAAQPSSPSSPQQQQPAPVVPGRNAAAASAGVQSSSAPQQDPAGSTGDSSAPAAAWMAAGTAGFDSSQPRVSGLARSSAPVLSAAQHGSRGVLPRPASHTSLAGAAAAAAADDAAPGEPAVSRGYKSVTVGQLAREGLNRRNSVLLGAMAQQPLQLQQPGLPQPPQQQQQGRGGKDVVVPGGTAAGNRGCHRKFASEGGAAVASEAACGALRGVTAGATVGAGSSAAAAAAAAAAAVAAAGTQPISIDLQQLALFDGLERGMSAPNNEVVPFSPPLAGSRALVGQLRADRAVSTSPGALALLDAEDQMCLLQAAGTSLEDNDGDATLLGGNVLSWGRRGAADMVASFRENYNMRPIARSIARFGQSLTRSFGRSAGSPVGVKSPAPGCYMDAAAAAAATDTHTDAASRECSVTQAAASTLSFTQQGAVSPTAVAVAPAPPAAEAVTHDEISFIVAAAAGGPANAHPATDQQQVSLPAALLPSPVAATAAHVTAPRRGNPAAGVQLPIRSSEDSAISHQGSVGHQGSIEASTAFLGAQMSLDSSLAYSIWGAPLELARSVSSSLPGPLGLTLTPAAEAAEVAGAGQAPFSTHIPVNSGVGSRVAPSAFVSAAGAAAAAAAAAAEPTGGLITPVAHGSLTAAGAAATARRGVHVANPADGLLGTARLGPVRSAAAAAANAGLASPGVRAAATAAAARAEEEGIGLPNGLWLQQSQSIKNSTLAGILQLLSPTKRSSTDDGAAAAAAQSEEELGSAGGCAQLAAAESRSLSGSVQPALGPSGSGSADITGVADLLAGDAATGAGSAAIAAAAAAAEGGLVMSPRGSSGEAAGSTATDRESSPGGHSRHISMISWLKDSSSPAAPQPAASGAEGPVVTAAGAAPDEVWGSAGDIALPVSPAKDIATAGVHSGAAAAVRQVAASLSAVAGSQSSRAVSMPRSVAAAARSRGSHAGHPWLTPVHGRHRSCGRDSTPAEGAVAAAAAASGAAGGAGGSTALERLPSAADSSVEFYVGSFWSPVGLANRADARQQQLAEAAAGHTGPRHLARSTSSMGRLDSLQDSLPGGSLSTAAELDFAGALGLQPEQEGMLSPGGNEQPVGLGRNRCSSGGVGGAVFGSGGGAVLKQRDRVSMDGAEGLLEGCLPADSSGETWNGHPGASVLVRVHSGRAGVGRGAAVAGKATVAAAAGDKHSVRGSGANMTATAGMERLGGTAAALSPSTAAVAAAAEIRPYKWIAKTVASMSVQEQPQPQFDAFDEPHGQWYYAGA